MSKIESLIVELRREKVLGPVRDPWIAHLMFSSEDTILMRYQSPERMYGAWVLVQRSSKQYYKITALVSRYDHDYVTFKTFRDIRSSTEYIKEIIRR